MLSTLPGGGRADLHRAFAGMAKQQLGANR